MSENILKPNQKGSSQCLHLLTYSRQQAQVPPPIFARLLELLPLPPTRLKFTQDGKQVQQIILQTICLHLLTGATRSMTEKFLPYLYSSAFRTFTSKPKFRLQSPSCKVKQNRQRSTWPSIHSLHHYKVKQNKKSLQLIFAVLFKRIGSTSSVLCQNVCIAPRGLCHLMPERIEIYSRFHYLHEDLCIIRIDQRNVSLYWITITSSNQQGDLFQKTM